MSVIEIDTARSSRQARRAGRVRDLPVPIYGAALALLGLGLVLPFAWTGSPSALAVAGLRAAGEAVLMAALLLHGAKACIATAAFLDDLRNPVSGPFFGQIGVALALLSELSAESRAPASAIEVSTASLAYGGAVALAAASTVQAGLLLVFRRSSWRSASPAWLLPGVQCLYVGALTNPAFATARALAWGCGGALGLAATLGLAARGLRGPPWPAPAKPALAIFLAVPSLALIGLLQHASDPVSDGRWVDLAFAATLSTWLVVVASLRRAVGRRFALSWWAYGMPLSAAAVAFHDWAGHHGGGPWLLAGAGTAGWLSVGVTTILCIAGARAGCRFFFGAREP